jgi:hypothetical protein
MVPLVLPSRIMAVAIAIIRTALAGSECLETLLEYSRALLELILDVLGIDLVLLLLIVECVPHIVLEPLLAIVGVSAISVMVDVVGAEVSGALSGTANILALERQSDQVVACVEVPFGDPETILHVSLVLLDLATLYGMITRDVVSLPVAAFWRDATALIAFRTRHAIF